MDPIREFVERSNLAAILAEEDNKRLLINLGLLGYDGLPIVKVQEGSDHSHSELFIFPPLAKGHVRVLVFQNRKDAEQALNSLPKNSNTVVAVVPVLEDLMSTFKVIMATEPSATTPTRQTSVRRIPTPRPSPGGVREEEETASERYLQARPRNVMPPVDIFNLIQFPAYGKRAPAISFEVNGGSSLFATLALLKATNNLQIVTATDAFERIFASVSPTEMRVKKMRKALFDYEDPYQGLYADRIFPVLK
jgi:hypothetical protein